MLALNRVVQVVVFSFLISYTLTARKQELGPYAISTVAFDPTGTLLAVTGGPPICNDDPNDTHLFNITILDSVTNEVIQSFGDFSCKVNSISWSPDGTRIAASSDEGTASVWNAATGEKVSMYGSSGKGVRSLYGASWNPVDNRIVVLGGGRDVTIWDAETGAIISRVFDKGTLGVQFSAWSSDGTKMALATLDEKIEIFDVSPLLQTPPLLLRFASGKITALIWNPNGDEVVVTSGQDAKIYDTATGQLIQTLIGSTDTLRAIAWSSDGERIAAGGEDYTVRIWDVETGKETSALVYGSTILNLDWSADGAYLAYGGYHSSADKLIEIAHIPLLTD